ncbi:MAG: alkaline phosphatase family protein, partial [Lentisphaerae bacterium]|nr:alkaline phosphatase family protein [Lentisphaerota bacterium]
ILAGMDKNDSLVVISDHGFCQRPFHLVNLNEILRQAGLLTLRREGQGFSVRLKQTMKRHVIRLLSKLHLLDILLPRLKRIRGMDKYKKSDFLIDRETSVCFVDPLFSGKKPYVGLNFGDAIRRLPPEQRKIHSDRVIRTIRNHPDIPPPRWIKPAAEVYSGPWVDRLPDICMEWPPEYGVEFDLFAPPLVQSATHYRLSGGHYGASTYGFYSPENHIRTIASVLDVHDMILSLLPEA